MNGEFKLEEEEEEYKVETVLLNSIDDWGGEGIDADDKRDGDVDSECLIDVDINGEDNNEEDIKVEYAKAKLFLDYVNEFSRTECNHSGFNLSLD